VVSCGEFRAFWGLVWFCFGILGGGDWELCFFLHKIRGEFVVNTWFLCGFWLVGNDDDKDRGELCVVDQFGVTEVSEKPTLREIYLRAAFL